MEFQVLYESYISKYEQKTQALFHAIKDGIMSGRYADGTKLPSSRELAAMYGMSRGTVNVAYEMLHAQGYVRSETGRGTFVVFREVKGDEGNNQEFPTATTISTWGSRIDTLPIIHYRRSLTDTLPEAHLQPIDFMLGRVELSYFPVKEWNRYLYEQVRKLYDAQMEDAYSTAGHGPLREAIAVHLRRTRGLGVHADQIVIVNGSLQALTFLVQLLIDPGDTVVTENPMYRGSRRAIETAGGVIHACPVDDDGMLLAPDMPAAKLAIVTPGRQFPTGATMSMARRLALLQWAEEKGVWIIEDDYDTEFRFRGRPIEPLKALDRSGRVTFIGTFSRTMLQDIRIGYAVLPPRLVQLFLKAKQLYEPHPSSILEQRALAAFMNEGHYERHLRRMRRVYKKRFDGFSQLLREQLGHRLDIQEQYAGLHIYARWKGTQAELDRFRVLCAEQQVRFPHIEDTFVTDPVPTLALGFAHLDETQLAEAVQRMSLAVKRL